MLSLKSRSRPRTKMQQVQFLAAQSRSTVFPCHITQCKYQSRVQAKCARKLARETDSIRDNGISEVNQILVLGSMLVPFTLRLGFVGSHAKCGCQSNSADDVGDLLLLVFCQRSTFCCIDTNASVPVWDTCLSLSSRLLQTLVEAVIMSITPCRLPRQSPMK